MRCYKLGFNQRQLLLVKLCYVQFLLKPLAYKLTNLLFVLLLLLFFICEKLDTLILFLYNRLFHLFLVKTVLRVNLQHGSHLFIQLLVRAHHLLNQVFVVHCQPLFCKLVLLPLTDPHIAAIEVEHGFCKLRLHFLDRAVNMATFTCSFDSKIDRQIIPIEGFLCG